MIKFYITQAENNRFIKIIDFNGEVIFSEPRTNFARCTWNVRYTDGTLYLRI